MPLALRTIIGLIIALLLGGCSRAPESEIQVHNERAGIVAGQPEAGFDAVGALTYFRGGRYFGTFCTGTLIHPQWVLTSASCLDLVEELLDNVGEDFEPSRIQFFVGNDAGNTGSPPPGDDVFFDIDQVFAHPNWNPSALVPTNDLALIHLIRPVPDVEPMPLQRADIARLRGAMLTYVGMGVVNGELGTGRGDKRLTTLEMRDPLAITYSSVHVDTGVCLGDGGGPGLFQVGGEWNLVGITSLYNEHAPICLDYSIQTRVDAFVTWIDMMLGDDVNCNIGQSPCTCNAACERDGLCDQDACGMGNCSVIYNCARVCQDPQCIYGCLSGGTRPARIRFENLSRCIQRHCEPDDANCVLRRCLNEHTTCFASGPIPNLGQDPCWTVYQCTRACNNDACREMCLGDASPDGHQAALALTQCRARNCGHLNNPAAKDACAYAACPAYYRRCNPPDHCSLAGGDCGAGTTCFVQPWDSNYCVPTLGLPMGANCNPAEPQCADGVLCVTVGNQTNCRASCLDNEDCSAAGTECRVLEELPDGPGVCVPCADNDQDGACNVDDCAPNDNTIAPNLPDACHNLVDNDCDDIVDEGCDIPDEGVEDAMVVEDAGQDALVEDAGVVVMDEGTTDATTDGAAADGGALMDIGVDAAQVDMAPTEEDMAVPQDAQNTDDMNPEAADLGADQGDGGDASDASDAEIEVDVAVFKTGRIRGGSVIVACDCAQGTTGSSGFIWGLILLLGRAFIRRRR